MLAITEANTKNLKKAAAPKMQTYGKKRDAQSAAVREIGPQARDGFEYNTSKVDGRWIWRAVDEADRKPETEAQIKANGGKRSLVQVTADANEAMRNGEYRKAAEIVADGLDIPDFLRRSPETEQQRDERLVRMQKVAGPDRKIKNPPAAPKKESAAKTAKPENKTAMIGQMLTRKGGCTTAEILAATGWPAVSVPAIAKACRLDLRKEKDGRITRYYGTPAK